MEVRAPVSVKTAEQAIEYAIDTYEVEENLDPSRLKFLRVSSFPFCGTQWLLNYPAAVSGKRSSKFMGSFFTSVGTTVHNSLQGIMNYSPFLIQDWKCFSCGHLHQFTLRPRRCAKCKVTSRIVGREHEYKKPPIVGHLDGAVLLKGGKIVIIDYKTTSIRKMETKGLLPSLENVRQIEAYAALLKQEGYDIDGWTLIYIARNNAKRIYKSSTEFYGHSFEEEYPRILKRIGRYEKDFIAVSTAVTVENAAAVVGKRRFSSVKEDVNDLCHYCKFKPVCGNESLLESKLAHTFRVVAKTTKLLGAANV